MLVAANVADVEIALVEDCEDDEDSATGVADVLVAGTAAEVVVDEVAGTWDVLLLLGPVEDGVVAGVVDEAAAAVEVETSEEVEVVSAIVADVEVADEVVDVDVTVKPGMLTVTPGTLAAMLAATLASCA